MPDPNWVFALGKCSGFEVFSLLRSGVESDVAARNSLASSIKDGLTFKIRRDINPTPDRFTVLRLAPDDSFSDSVFFTLSDKTISVIDRSMEPTMQGTVTLNDDGECRIRVGDQDLELWQFRRRALEALFRF